MAASAAGQNAGSFNRTGSGARAAGMGNAFIAVADDGTAATWNPAGLAQLRKPELSFVVSSNAARVDMEGFRSPDERFTFTPRRADDQKQYIDFASLAIPATIGRPVTFQLGWRRQYSLDTDIGGGFLRQPTGLAPGEPVVELYSQLRGRGSADIISLATAVRATPRLSLGVSLDLYRGDWDFRALTRQRAEGEAPDYLERGQAQGISGASLSVGAMVQAGGWRAGAVYHAPLDADFHTTVTLDSTLPEPGFSISQSVSTGARMKFPASLGLGASWKPAPPWTLAADVTYDEWKEWTVVGIPGFDEPISFADDRPVSTTSTRNTLSLNLGAEWILQKSGFLVPFRVGFAHEPQGQRDPNLFTGYALRVLSIGTGYNTNRFKFDVALQRSWFDVPASQALAIETQLGLPGTPPYDALGQRQERYWRLKVSAIVRIADTEKLKRVLGDIFGGS